MDELMEPAGKDIRGYPCRQVPSTHPLPAIHIVGLCHHIVGIVTGQKHGHAGKIFRLSHPAKRHIGANLALLLSRRLVLISGEECVDPVPVLAVDNARGNGVHIYSVSDQIQPCRLCKADHGATKAPPARPCWRRLCRAVISLTQSAGLNLIGHGINVNAIAPGVVDGEHWDGVDAFFARYENKAPGQKKREVGANVPFGRMGKPEDLAGMAVFLASDDSDYVVAQTYNVDGGQWMS